MPRFNERSQVLAGNAGALSIDRVEIAPRASANAWRDADHVIANINLNGRWVVGEYDLRSGKWTELQDGGANFIAAGGGRWAGFTSARGIFGDVMNQSAGFAGVGTDGRGTCSSTGTFALVHDYQAGTGLELHDVTGVIPTTAVIASGPYVLAHNQALWSEADGRLMTFGLPTPPYVAPCWSCKRVMHRDRPWLVYYNDPHGVIAHPEAALTECRQIALTNAFHHDAVSVNGRLLVCYSTGVGELPHEVRVVDVETLPVYDLTTPHIASIPRPVWTGYFYAFSDQYGDNPSAPGSCAVVNELGAAMRADRPVLATPACLPAVAPAKLVGCWLHCATVHDIEMQVPSARALLESRGLRRPVMAYLDWPTWDRQPSVRPDWYGLQVYPRETESRTALLSRTRVELAAFPSDAKIALVAKAYLKSIESFDLGPWQSVYADLVREDARIVALLWFSDGRSGGTRDHENLRPIHRAIVAAVQPPSIPPDTKPPKPPETPKPPEVPEMPYDRQKAENDAADLAVKYFGIANRQEAWQGCHEMGDRYEGANKHASVSELVFGAVFRSTLHKRVEDLDQFIREALEKEGLRRV